MVKILHRMMIALCRDTIILQIKTLLKIGVIQSMVCYLVFLTVLILKQKNCCSKEVMNVGNILKEQPYFGLTDILTINGLII